jgi:hypothetical protein
MKKKRRINEVDSVNDTNTKKSRISAITLFTSTQLSPLAIDYCKLLLELLEDDAKHHKLKITQHQLLEQELSTLSLTNPLDRWFIEYALLRCKPLNTNKEILVILNKLIETGNQLLTTNNPIVGNILSSLYQLRARWYEQRDMYIHELVDHRKLFETTKSETHRRQYEACLIQLYSYSFSHTIASMQDHF